MTINKALEHFKWKFQNKWKPTTKDIDSFNCVIDFVNDSTKKNVNNNILFAKLYVTYLSELMKYYKADVFSDIPQKELHKQLDKPFNEILKEFIDCATDIEQSKEYEIEGVLKHPMQLTSDQKRDIKIIDKVMTIDEAERNLTTMINLALNKFS